MTPSIVSFLDTKNLTSSEIENLFLETGKIKAHFLKTGVFPSALPTGSLVALLFFEASTRTRLSFEIAIQRLGGRTTFFDGASKEGTSLIKGETLEDTFWTLHSMLPDMIIVRCGDDFPLYKVQEKSRMPIINAGYGTESHPTQALLDAYTMLEYFPTLENRNVLFVGDVRHSRVAHSNMDLLSKLGANLAVVGPKEFLKGLPSEMQTFTTLQEAIPWADVCMGLRIQFERHQEGSHFSREDFISQYQLHKGHESLFKKDALIFHPGPVNWGVELNPNIRELPHFKMWEQKQNGVFTRAALLNLIARKNGKASHA
jgi:aspartate carbamoyltransferase catalytic subunit